MPADLRCPITQSLFYDAVALRGHLFERDAITAWLVRSGRHPLLEEEASAADLAPAPDVTALAHRFARHHGLRRG